MQIIIDADACPVTRIAEKIAKEKNIPLMLFCDTSHIISIDYGKVIVVDKGSDAVDFALINKVAKGDIVVTQDYGVATMALAKGAYAIHQSGRWYTDGNIDGMLFERHMAKKIRRSSPKHHGKGARKRSLEDDIRFEKAFRKLINDKIR